MVEDGDGEGALGSIASISEGAGLFLLGRGVSNGFNFLTNVLLTRFLGTTLYGIYAYLTVVYALISVLTRLGGDKAMLRYLPEYEDRPIRQRVMLTLAYGTGLVMSVLVAGAVYAFAPTISAYTLDEPLFVDVLRLTAIVIPFNTLSKISYSVFKGIERMEYDVAVSSVARPAFRLIFLGGAVALGYSLVGVAAGLIVSSLLTLIAALGILAKKTELGAVARPTRRDAGQYYNFSLPVTFNQLGNFLYNRVDLLMVGLLLSGSVVGIYNVAVLVSRILSLPLSAFNQLFPTIASRLYHNNEMADLETVYRSITRIIFTVSLFPAIAMILYAPQILFVFGEQFTRGESVLILFTVAQLTNCLVGPSGYLLMMSDRQYLTLVNQLSSGILNGVLNYVLIIEYGFIGAAVATASVLAAVNLLRLLEVWYLEGLFPYDWKYVKPVSAGVAAGAVMYALTFILGEYALLVVGGATGGAVYAGLLYAFGLEERDLELIRRYRS